MLPAEKICYHYTEERTAGESFMKSLAALSVDNLWASASDMSGISVLNHRR